MTVLCCYTELHPATAEALAAYAPGAELVDVSGSPYAYGQEVARRWLGREDLVNIEHDIEINGSVLPEFSACRSDWCVFPYEIAHRGNWVGVVAQGLGCVKFSAALQRAVDRRLFCTPFENTCGCGPGCWHVLDKVVTGLAALNGFSPCVHLPGLVHHRPEITLS
jgi:hypothetical protein